MSDGKVTPRTAGSSRTGGRSRRDPVLRRAAAAPLAVAARLRAAPDAGRRHLLRASGLLFWSLGARPIAGFFGLDILAIQFAFRLNYRAARAREIVEVTRDRLVVERIAPNGRSESSPSTYWARFEVERVADWGITRMVLTSHGRRLAIGSFLNPDDREGLPRRSARRSCAAGMSGAAERDGLPDEKCRRRVAGAESGVAAAAAFLDWHHHQRHSAGTDAMNIASALATADPVRRPASGLREIIRRAIEFLTERWREQPSLEQLAQAVGMNPLSLQKLFTRWCGLSPKAFIQAHRSTMPACCSMATLRCSTPASRGRARRPERLHDLFVTHEAMSPARYRRAARASPAVGFSRLALRLCADPDHRSRPCRPAPSPIPATRRTRSPTCSAASPAPPMRRTGRRRRLSRRASSNRRAGGRMRRSASSSSARFRGPRLGDAALGAARPAATYSPDRREGDQQSEGGARVGAAVGRNPISFVVPCHQSSASRARSPATIGD